MPREVSNLKRSNASKPAQKPIKRALQSELTLLSDDQFTETCNATSLPSEIRRLPKVLAGCVRTGLTACEIGQYLHDVIEDMDADIATARNDIVSKMVEAGTPYHEIGRRMLKLLDVRDEYGHLAYRTVPLGFQALSPCIGKDASETSEDESVEMFSSAIPSQRSPVLDAFEAQIACTSLEQIDNEDDDEDEEVEIGVAQAVTVRKVVPRCL